MSRFATGRFGAASALALPVLLLDFLAWILLLAGVSALQHQCSSQAEVINSTAPIGQIFPATTCRNVYRFQWWILWLQFMILVGALATVAMGYMSHHRIALIGLLAIVTVLLVLDTNTFAYVHDAISHGSLWRRANTYFAGTILSSLLNFLLIITLGHSGETYGRRGEASHLPTHTHTHTNPVAHPHTGPTTTATGPTGTTTGAAKGPMGPTTTEPVASV